MKTLTFILMLVMEFSYAMWLISSYMDSEWRWITFLPVGAVCGLTALAVYIYCRIRKVPDVKAIMKSGTALLFGIEAGAVAICYIAENWRWFT